MTTPPPRAEKQQYAQPVLKTYGDLSQLTQAKGMSGSNSDGALANNNKTR